MIHSLRFRLMVAFLLVILVTIGTASFFVARSTWIAVNQMQENNNAVRTARIQSLLSYYYLINGSWNNSQDLIDQLYAMDEIPIILTDPNEVVVAATDSTLIGKTYKTSSQGIPLSFTVINRPGQPPN